MCTLNESQPSKPTEGEPYTGWLDTDQTLEVARKVARGIWVRTWSKERDAPGLHVEVGLEALEYFLRLSESTGGPRLHHVFIGADWRMLFVS